MKCAGPCKKELGEVLSSTGGKPLEAWCWECSPANPATKTGKGK